ncbi:uncharacterized protein LOC135833627 [Planococcus citri]|uniref:uncharacterized protein LOC135833627 n=1 Tax=Planococcus citri TaxID=170843 RepID=UPI0031FA0B8D
MIGEAAELVLDTPLTDKGYDEAWCLVQATYRDIKKITRKHFDQLFSIRRIKNSDEISTLLAHVNRALKGLKACGEDPDNWGPVLCYLVSEKLDETTYTEFEKTLTTNTKFPSWKSLKSFLENRASITRRPSDIVKAAQRSNASQSKRTSLTTAVSDETKSKSPQSDSHTADNKMRRKCACCEKQHLLIDCETFKSKSPKERYEFLKTKNICGNCFYANHKTSECRKSPNCKRCTKKHHTLLHFEEKQSELDTSRNDSSSGSSATCGMFVQGPYASMNESVLLSVRKPVPLLPSAIVKYQCGDKSGTMRVLLDSCSQVNLISETFVKQHGLYSTKVSQTSNIVGVGKLETSCSGVVNMTLQSRIENFEYCTHLSIVDRIPYSLHNLFVDNFSSKVHQHGFNLADTAFYDRVVNIPAIDAVLGIEAYDKCVRGRTVKIESACLRDTTFGWTVSSLIESSRNSGHSEGYCGLTLDERVERFWKIEDIPNDKKVSEHDACREHFMKTYRRAPDGSFIVRLPFKEDPEAITGNFGIALKYLNRIESKLDTKTKAMYSDFMEEYQALNHMSIVDDEKPRYFIPHHAVLRPSSTTTKLRVVFHASAKSYCGKSLNDVLMVGPTLQPELFDTSLRFRTRRWAIVADISGMYRCVWVDEEDRRFQSIIWRGKKRELNTITYGTGNASYTATACLEVVAEEVKETQPVVSESIKKDFYVDDWLSGADSVEEAIELQRAVHEALLSGGFKLRKYQSNSKHVIDQIDPTLVEHNLTIQFGENESLSVLGLFWCPGNDTFMLKSDVPEPKVAITKRQMLSTISKVFDPLGLASPVTIRGKLMLKKLWKLGVAWDDTVPSDVEACFSLYLNDLRQLAKFEIPRYIREFNSETETIVGFCDASEQA